MAKSEPQSATQATKTIKLMKPHEHAGREYPVGSKLTLPADSADWLISLGHAEPV